MTSKTVHTDAVAIKFDNAFYCKACGGMATVKTCCHTDVARLTFTSSMVREMLQKGKPLPQEFTRPEIGVILMEAFRERKKSHGENGRGTTG
jgi:sulfate adenylyltransferase